MPLNLSTSDGEFTPYLKYNAKAGRFYVRPQGATQDVEIINPRLVFDMENIRTGWLYYAEGSGPEKLWDPSREQMAPRPPGPKKFKRGFEVMVFGNDQIPGVGPLGLREFSSTANNVIGPILSMFDQYEAQAGANPGCVPFYACLGVNAIPGAYGTNYEPRFELKGWVPRLKIPAFDEHADKVPNGTGATTVQPDADSFAVRSQAPLSRGADGYNAGPALDDDIPF